MASKGVSKIQYIIILFLGLPFYRKTRFYIQVNSYTPFMVYRDFLDPSIKKVPSRKCLAMCITGWRVNCQIAIVAKSLKTTIKTIVGECKNAESMKRTRISGKISTSEYRGTIADRIAVNEPGQRTYGVETRGTQHIEEIYEVLNHNHYNIIK